MISRSDLRSDIWDLTPNLCDSVSSELDEPMMKPKLRIKDTEHQKTTTKRSRTEISDQGSQFEPRVTISELPLGTLKKPNIRKRKFTVSYEERVPHVMSSINLMFDVLQMLLHHHHHLIEFGLN